MQPSASARRRKAAQGPAASKGVTVSVTPEDVAVGSGFEEPGMHAGFLDPGPGAA
ncbi:protein of unassigned function [Methylobacterium oryzae CBMB20]|uniref:Protein of unassigned function n=1 Tax=Methylobacterium oryzae CBMB20 TaxID=693986 RepID=A0A089P3V4_9HYPH|nr:protein of unassigned function [Methylobacterium oryzae CBMB20]